MAGRETLLIAENSIENRTILAEIFSEEYELIEVEDGVRALTLLREKTEEIFAVLLDVALPLADGFAVLEEMKRDPRLETIPVVMMTALDEPQNEVRALQHGATDFVVKPFVPEVIFQRVRNVVRQRKLERYLSEKMLMELDYRANHDPLTGIYNKEAFYRMTAELLQKNPSRKFVLLRWNIERFKLINELFGKEVGDRILRQLAENFQKKLTTIGTYGRLEADHFAICLPAKYLDAPLFLVQTGELMGKLDIPYTVTVAFGIYEIDDPDIPVDQMCDRANLALQTIKGKYKRHYALYNDTMRQTMLREQEIRGEMAEALATRQFQVFLQPIYSLSADRTVSAEALVRWTHPRKGTISPGEFIPLFEKSGFISELDHYVWEEACRYLKQRRERGLAPLPISVNASRMSLYSPDLFREIVELTEKYGVEPALFKLEITETAYAADPAQLMQTTRKLQAAGFSVLMDDFGSGYSSLNTLKDLPVDILKIDMKFLDGFESGGRVGTVLISVLRMAKWLNLPVIAEGVETKEQLAFLRSVGCDLIQGFCVAKPMAMEGFEDYIEETHLGVETSEELLFSGEDFDAVLGGNRLINRLMEGMFGGFGLYEYNEDYIEILRANDGYYSLLGYTPETLTADSRDIWVHTFAEDVGQAKAACREAISTGKAVRLVLRRYHKDGRLLYLDTIVRHLGGGSQGTLLCIAFNDITQQLENERRMQEKQERYRLISESAGAVVLEWDFRTKAFTASEGYEAFQISRQDPFTLCDTVFASTDEAAVCQLEKWDGTAVWCRVARTDVREKTGEIVRSIASITNVDAEKRAEQQLLYRDQLAQILLADSDTLTFDYYTGTDCIQVNYVDRAGGRANRTIPQFRRFVLRAHMVHPDDRLLLLQMTDATCSMEGSLEFRGEFRGHSYRWYRLTYASLSDENGKVHRIVGKAVDITESRKVESRYREELDFTRALGVGLVSSCRVNLTTKCIEYSRGEGRVSQLPVNAPMSDALFLRHADEFLVDSGERASYGAKFCPSKLLADYENGVTEQEMEYRARMEDDTVRWLHLRVKLLKKPDTSEVVAFYNTWDIHEKHVAREVIDSVVTLDYDYLMYIRAGDHNYALFPSKKADGHTVSTGGNYDEECRHRIATALHREDRRRAVKQLALDEVSRQLETNDSYSIILRILTENGGVAHKRLTFSRMNGDGDLIMTRRDITGQVLESQRQREVLLKALEEARSANRAKEDFLSRMSHELRTPMNAVIGLAGLALEEPLLPIAAGEYLDKIQYASEYLLSLLNDILDVSRIEAGKFRLHEAPLALHDFVEQLETIVKPGMVAKNIRFLVEIGCAIGKTALVDKVRILQVFVNLLTNATKFTPVGGEIAFTIRIVEETAAYSRMHFEVRDTGIGMSREFLDKLFLPFTQERTATDDYGGAGLGLTIVKKIVDAMQGTIAVDSRVDRGTTVTLELPLQMVQAGAVEETAQILPDFFDFSGRRALLVEDHPINAEIAARLLKKKGFAVDLAVNGQEAVEKFTASARGTYSAILMDIRMPVMDGLTATRQIRAQTRGDAKTIPILAMTANVFDSDVQESLSAGLDAHLDKPIAPKQLYQTLAALIFSREGGQQYKESERRIRQQEKIYKILLTESRSRIFEYTPATDCFIYSETEEDGRRTVHTLVNYHENLMRSSAVHPRFRQEILAAMDTYSKTGGEDELLFQADFEGTGYHWHEAYFKSVQDGTGKVTRIVGKMDDVDKKTKRTLALREKAEYDGITGLYNRATYEEMVENVLADHNRGLCAFVEFDLDNFKQVNDTYGHLTGDKLLHQVATAVAKSCRKEDLLGRLGGDEFAIWFSDVGNVENVVKKIQEISCQIQEISTGMALQVHVTASFGIVMVGPGDRSFRGLFRKSDEAMYEVKHSGKNSYQIYRPKK